MRAQYPFSISDTWNGITACASVVGVIVAATLGFWAVRIAKKTITRSELEYRAKRADLILDRASGITRIAAEYKAALHVFWKDANPEGVGESYTQRLQDAQSQGESRAHELDYALAAARDEFRAIARSVETEEVKLQRALAHLDLLWGGLRLHYLSVVNDPPLDVNRAVQDYSEALIKAMEHNSTWRMCAETPYVSESIKDEIELEVHEWYATSRRGPDETPSPKQISIDFLEEFAQPRWTSACAELVKPIHDSALKSL